MQNARYIREIQKTLPPFSSAHFGPRKVSSGGETAPRKVQTCETEIKIAFDKFWSHLSTHVNF